MYLNRQILAWSSNFTVLSEDIMFVFEFVTKNNCVFVYRVDLL